LADKDNILEDLNSYKTLDQIKFGDILGDGISATERDYDEINDIYDVIKKIEVYLEEYNATSKKQMNLALFDFAVSHVLRIGRIMKMAGGNALLVGLGGSGRQTLTKLASLVCDYDVFMIQVTK